MLHLLGAGIWAGGLPPLALLLFTASRQPEFDFYAVRTLQRFSHVALITVLLLAGSGVTAALLLVGSVAGLFGTAHGQLLVAKVAVLAMSLLLAAASRAELPRLWSLPPDKVSSLTRRVGVWIATEAGLVLVLLAFAAAMTLTTPAIHGDPDWPLPFRLSLARLPEIWGGIGGNPWRFRGVLIGVGLVAAALVFAARRPPLTGLVMLSVVMAAGVVITMLSITVEAFPTSFVRSPVTYQVGSIAEGMASYQSHCIACHGALPTAKANGGLKYSFSEQRSAGELFWLITHGRPERGMPEFSSRLSEAERWHLVNFVRASEAAADPSRIGPKVDFDHPWLVAPDFSISVGPLTPGALRDFGGRQMVLLVLYALPTSRPRMIELAHDYGALSVLGVEVVAVSPRSSPDAIAELGSSPPILYPVVTEGNEEIYAAYRLLAPGSAHAEFLIDRQGYIRAIWRGDETGIPNGDAVQAQVERLNEEKSPPPLPDDHVH